MHFVNFILRFLKTVLLIRFFLMKPLDAGQHFAASSLVTKSDKLDCLVDVKSSEVVCFGESKIGNIFVGKLQLILKNI